MKHWTLDDIDWTAFDSGRTDPGLTEAIKAASLVEQNAGDYAAYLCNVFADDPEFCAAAQAWAEEEIQHGDALRRWAELADPDFDFDGSLHRFVDGYQLPLDSTESVRGSRTGELVARCIVEVGTSSFYAAIQSATDEPVLKQIARNIRADELRHYKLFYTHMKRYLDSEKLGQLRRLMIALGRIRESEDDELAYAYYCANDIPGDYVREKAVEAYARRAFSLYRRPHVERAVMMTCKAAGLNPQGRVARVMTDASWWLMRRKVEKLERRAA